MSAGTTMLRRSIERTARTNWHVVSGTAIEIGCICCCIALGVYFTLLSWMGP